MKTLVNCEAAAEWWAQPLEPTSEAVGDAGSISAKLTVRRTGGGVWNPFASSAGGVSPRCGDETPVNEGVRSALGSGVRA